MALGEVWILTGAQALVMLAVLAVLMMRRQLPDEIDVFLVGRRMVGEAVMSTDTALLISGVVSGITAATCAWTLVWLARSTAVMMPAIWAGMPLGLTAVGTPVALGFMMTALTGWSAWLLAVLVGIFVLVSLLKWRERTEARRWLLTESIDSISLAKQTGH